LLRPFFAATLITCTLSACTSPASLAAGVVNTFASKNPNWNLSMAQMVKATDCNQDGQLGRDEINRCWTVSDDDNDTQNNAITPAEYDRALAEISPAKGDQADPDTYLVNLITRLTSYHRNYRFLGPCR
jgi:hypothetical protein